MGIVIKSSIRYSIIMYLGIILGFLNTIIIFPNILSEEVFGLTRMIMSASAVIAQFASLGTGNILVRFHPHLKDDRSNTTLSLGILISGAGFLMACLFLLFFKPWIVNQFQENSELFTEFYYILIPYVASLVLFTLFDAFLRVILKNSIPAFLNFIVLRFLWLITVLIYATGILTLDNFIHLYVISHMLIVAIALVYIIYLGKLNLSFDFGKQRRKQLNEMTGFGVFTVISGISLFLINRVDILMVGKYIGLEEVAIYTIAFYMSTVIMVPAQSISRTANVLVADSFKRNDMSMVKSFYEKTALNQLLLGGVIYILIILNYQNIMTFLPEAYSGSLWVFVLLGFAKMVDTGLGVNGAIILQSKYYKFDTYSSIILLILTVVSNIIFIPVYGITGAALATALSLIIFNLAKYAFLKVKLGMDPFSIRSVYAFLLLIVTFIIPFYIPQIEITLLDIFIRSAAAGLIFILVILKFNISHDLKNIISDTLGKVTTRNKN